MKDLTCPVCGRTNMSHLTSHLKRTHGLSKEDVIIKYPDIKFISDDLNDYRKFQLDQLRVDNWNNPEYRSKMQEAARANMIELNSNSEIRKLALDNAYDSRMAHAESDPSWWKDTRSKAATNGWKNSSRKIAHSNLLKTLWKDSDYRQKHSKRLSDEMLKVWSDINKVNNSSMRYHSRGKRINYINNSGKLYKLRSSWEYIVAVILDRFNIRYEFEYLSIPYIKNGKVSNYIPDFILIDYDIILEVHPSSMIDDVMLAKLAGCKYQGYEAIFLTDNDIFKSPEDVIKIIEVKCSSTIERVSAS